MKLVRNIVCALLVAVIGNSCIREDFSECYSENKLIFSYKGDGTEEIFNEKITRVQMFVFDADNICVASLVVPDAQVAARKADIPQLKEGDYRIVCIGNTYSTATQGVDSRTYSSMLFADEDYFSGGQVSGNDALYYSSVNVHILAFEDALDDQVYTAEFRCSHYDLSVEVVGVPEGSSAFMELEGAVPCTDFENKSCGNGVTYYLESNYVAGTHTLTNLSNIMRFTDPTQINLKVYAAEGSAPLATVNFAEFLAAHPSVDVTKQEAIIPIRIEFRSAEVVVTLPDWYAHPTRPEF